MEIADFAILIFLFDAAISYFTLSLRLFTMSPPLFFVSMTRFLGLAQRTMVGCAMKCARPFAYRLYSVSNEPTWDILMPAFDWTWKFLPQMMYPTLCWCIVPIPWMHWMLSMKDPSPHGKVWFCQIFGHNIPAQQMVILNGHYDALGRRINAQ